MFYFAYVWLIKSYGEPQLVAELTKVHIYSNEVFLKATGQAGEKGCLSLCLFAVVVAALP